MRPGHREVSRASMYPRSDDPRSREDCLIYCFDLAVAHIKFDWVNHRVGRSGLGVKKPAGHGLTHSVMTWRETAPQAAAYLQLGWGCQVGASSAVAALMWRERARLIRRPSGPPVSWTAGLFWQPSPPHSCCHPTPRHVVLLYTEFHTHTPMSRLPQSTCTLFCMQSCTLDGSGRILQSASIARAGIQRRGSRLQIFCASASPCCKGVFTNQL